MNDKSLNLRVYGESEISRRGMLDALEVGESLVLVCAPGQAPGRLQAVISASFRDGERMSQQGLQAKSGLLVFEGENALPVVRITRTEPVRPKDKLNQK